MKSKDKKMAQYEIEARRAKRANKDYEEYKKDMAGFADAYVDLLVKGYNKKLTVDEYKDLIRMADAMKYSTEYHKNRVKENANKVKQAQEEDLEAKRKRFERAMKAAADKKKKEQEKTE